MRRKRRCWSASWNTAAPISAQPSSFATRPSPMSWKIAIVVALLTALITAAITAPVADHVTQKMKVSNFEGGRGYMVILMILAAFVGGVIIGLVTTSMTGAASWGQFWK